MSRLAGARGPGAGGEPHRRRAPGSVAAPRVPQRRRVDRRRGPPGSTERGDGGPGVGRDERSRASGSALTFDPAPAAPRGERVQAIAAFGAVALERARTDAELTAVRQRLVAVAEAERKRIERSLHDGAQQRLVADDGPHGDGPGGDRRPPPRWRRTSWASSRSTSSGRWTSCGSSPTASTRRCWSTTASPRPCARRRATRRSRSTWRSRRRPLRSGAGGGRLLLLRRGAPERAQARRDPIRRSASACGPTRTAPWASRCPTRARASPATRSAGGSGLMGMRDRVEGVGGTLGIDSLPGTRDRRSGGASPRADDPAGPPGRGAPPPVGMRAPSRARARLVGYRSSPSSLGRDAVGDPSPGVFVDRLRRRVAGRARRPGSRARSRRRG